MLHLKCSGRARQSVDRLILSTRADERSIALCLIDSKPTLAHLDVPPSSLELFVARLVQRVSQND